jgi:TetR/AcrR family transcriptional regulator
MNGEPERRRSLREREKVMSKTAVARVPRTRGRPARDKSDAANSRERLLDAAIDLFARYGYDPVSTKTVAEAAKLTQSMVHYHFGSKEELWKAAIDRLMRSRGRAFPVARLELKDVDPVTRLKILVRRLVEANAVEPNYPRILMHEAMAGTPRLKWLVDNFVGPGFEAFDRAVRLAIEANDIRDLPVSEVTSIITSAASLTFSIGAVTNQIYGIDVCSERFVQSFSDSMILVLFEGLRAPLSTTKRSVVRNAKGVKAAKRTSA